MEWGGEERIRERGRGEQRDEEREGWKKERREKRE